MAAKPLIVTVRIPFCPSRCSFCGENVHVPADEPSGGARRCTARHTPSFELRHEYADAVIKELHSLACDLTGHEVDALWFGGGAPLCCGAEALARIVAAARRELAWSPEAEVGVHTLPGTLGAEALASLREAGVRRFELGAGSLNLFEWTTLRRPVAFESPGLTARILASGGADFGVELYWGVPGQTARTLTDEVRSAVELGANHVRLTRLPLVAGTPLHRHFVEGKRVLKLPQRDLALPSEEDAAAAYAVSARELESRGLSEYAPGCFATAGKRLRAAVLSEAGCDSVELGCGGASLVDGVWTRNTSDLDRYVHHADDPALVVETVENRTPRN